MIWISAGSVDISPTESVYLGCGTGEKVSPEAIIDRLEANILVAYGSDKLSKVVIISVDTLFLGPRVSREIVAGLAGVFDEKDIFLAATHTHTAPMVDETKPRLGKRNDDYADFLVARILETTLALVEQEPSFVKINFWKSKLGGIVSRRKGRSLVVSRYGITRNKILQRPNFKEYREIIESTFVEFTDERGVVLAALGVIPCHAVAYQGLNVISSDVVGELRTQLTKQIPNDGSLPFIFLQGASGDLNPWLRSHLFRRGVVALIDQILNGFLFSSFSRNELYSWASARVREIISTKAPVEAGAQQQNAGQISSLLVEMPLSEVLENAELKRQRVFHVQRIQLENLKLLGVSAEITWEFKEQVSDFIVDEVLVGCIRDPFGYVCSESEYSKGGYEAGDHQESFSISHFGKKVPSRAVTAKLH